MGRSHLRLFIVRIGEISYSRPQFLSRKSRFLDGRYGKRFQSNQPHIQTMDNVRETLNKWMDSRIGWAPKPRDRAHLLKYLPTSQEELPFRTMKDSYGEAIIPLSSQPILQDRYVTATGKLRMGRVLEDMDFFSVYIALKYIKNPKQEEGMPTPYVIVTAGVDDIEYVAEKPDVTKDVKLSGKVVLVGQSSLDINVELETKVGESWKKMTVASFKMAARNSTLTGAAYVNLLKPDGPKEEKEMQAALARKLKKSEDAKISLLNSPPTPEEQMMIHQNFIKSVDLSDPTINKRVLPSGYVWMEDTKLMTSVFPHPENRNHHNTVFGGYLMRISLELAWMTAYTYSSQMPSLRYVNNVSFKRALSISSFLKIMSQVIYTHDNFMQIAVFIEHFDPVTREILTTNSFHFTYEVKNVVKPVMPRTYHESILWLEGARQMKKSRTLY